MEQDIKIFEHAKFGKVRVIIINGEPWFVGKDVATALKYSDAFAALKQHVPDKSKRVINAKTLAQMASNQDSRETVGFFFQQMMGGAQRLTFINEAGLYKLVLRSKLPTAEEFSDWICEEMLPSIRKIGMYSTEQVMKQFWNSIINAEPQFAYVYVFEMNNGTTKVGVSSDLGKRISCIESSSGLKILRSYSSSSFLRPIAFFLEYLLKGKLLNQHVAGEFFSVDYDKALMVLKALEQLVEELPLISNPKFGDKLLKLAEMMGDTPERQALLLEAGNIFVGKKFE